MKRFSIAFLILIVAAPFLRSEDTRLLRYPAVSDSEIAFVYGGDIYTVDINGGLARKLTNSDGFEIFPRFSPDGSQIAFSGEYDGNREVYLMPANGGEPKRLTYSPDMTASLPERMGPDKVVMGWTPDGKDILYRSRKASWNAFTGRLYLVDTKGSLPEELPLPRGGFASYSPDGKKLAYNRIFREFRTWKRYQGGMADDIWIYDFNTKKTEQITDNKAQDIIPMWAGNKVYFLSDRTKRMNLYSYNISTKETKQLTNYSDFDIKFPSLGKNHIVFEKGGYIYLLDLSNDKVSKVNIQVAQDFPYARTEIVNVGNKINSYEISPEGNRALFTARGDIFTVPREKGRTYNLTKSSGANDRNAVWSPDGKWIAFISDRSGEDEVYMMKPDGSDVIQLTDDAESYRFSLKWSPDSKYLLCSDKAMKLYYIDISSKKVTQVAKSKQWEIRDYKWSPDSKWIAYSDGADNGFSVVYLHSIEKNDTYPLTSEFFESRSPEFSEDGKYLFFVSNRTFNPQLGNFELSYNYRDMSTIFGITLQADEPTPFAYEEDKVAVNDGDNKKKSKKNKDDESKGIDIDNISRRIFELPVKAANYGGLKSIDNKLYYVVGGAGIKPGLKVFDFDKKEESEVGSIRGYEISADGKYILFRSGKDYYIEKLGAKVKPGDGKLDLDNMEITLDRREEWTQIFNEAWRQMKYFLYDPNLHGVDWNGVKKSYSELLPYVIHREDLTYIIGEMIGELNVGHAYFGGGDAPKTKKIPVGLLGVDFELDPGSGFYRIAKIYPGRNWEEGTRSPLTEPGIDVKEGDYLVMIDGDKLSAELHPNKALVNKAGKFVELKVNSRPSVTGAKDINVKTIAHENGLRYLDWVETNRRKVDEATDGQVAYIHIPNMMFEGLNEFVKYFYPQIRKKGLIVDDRFNGGGFVSKMILERLRRIMTMVGNARNQEVVSTYPEAVFTGPMLCMTNEYSASDGDIFPYNFRQNNLGKTIGKRTWGGVIGIRGSLPFVDGSYLNKPEFSHFSVDGKWILEGEGFTPDIILDNDPAQEYSGNDQQLNKAIEIILEEVKNYKGPKIPEVPQHPIRN